MVSYRLIGKGTTDSNGIAHMTKKTSDGGQTWSDTTGYVGQGIGKVDVVASTDNPLNSGSVQSEICSVLDCTFYDEGINVEGHYNTNWVNTNMQVSRNDTYTKLTSTVSGSSNQYAVPSAKIPNDNFVIEYTKTASTSNDFFILKDFAWDLYNFSNGSLRSAGTVKWVVDTTNKTMTPYFNGEVIPNGTRSYTNGSGAVRFQINGTDNDIEYNNFKIYPI